QLANVHTRLVAAASGGGVHSAHRQVVPRGHRDEDCAIGTRVAGLGRGQIPAKRLPGESRTAGDVRVYNGRSVRAQKDLSPIVEHLERSRHASGKNVDVVQGGLDEVDEALTVHAP